MSGKNRLDLTVVEGAVPAVIEEVKGQAGGADEDGMPDIFDQLIRQANHVAHQAEERLQVDDKGSGIADLQGFCAGIRAYKSAAKKAGFPVLPALFDTANRMTPWVQEIADSDDEKCDLDVAALRKISRLLDGLLDDPRYKELQDIIAADVSERKDWLFGKAERGRDLFWARGWYRGISWVTVQVKELYFWKGVKEKEKAETLPFDD